MPRFKLVIEYEGTPFLGWQIQADGLSVQGVLAQAVGAFCGEHAIPRGAGRTDAGVHALGQVAHLDLARTHETDTVRDALNAHLRPHPISVLSVEQVAGSFDARFSALRRHYRYRILNRRSPPALDRERVWHVGRLLDAEAMHRAGQIFVGQHDFTTFRASGCQAKSPVRTVDRVQVHRSGNMIDIEVSARSFLHNQVRSMAGALKFVGEGKWAASDLDAALQAADRTHCPPVAPAHGLTFMAVDYEDGVPGSTV